MVDGMNQLENFRWMRISWATTTGKEVERI
jgi:hypothetical protein